MSIPKRHPSSIRASSLPAVAASAWGLFMLGVAGTSQAAVQAQLDRSTVSEGGSLTLDIDGTGVPSGAQPDLAPLRKDFVVLGSGTQSETIFINGQRTDRMRWSIGLQPRHAGTLVIPEITLGTEHTAALEVKVDGPSPQAAAAAAAHVFLEVDSAGAGRSVYVQQQTPYTVRLYFDDTVQNGELAAPNPADAVVEQLGEEKRYTETRAGRSYNVIERNYAIAPEKSGTLRIPPVTFSGSTLLAQASQGQGNAGQGDDLFARMLRNTPLANDPFFRNSLGAGISFGDATQPVSAQGQETVLEVKPRPAGARGGWLPAEAIALHDSWQGNPPQLKAGEPVTRTITIEAKGLSASQIPPLSVAEPENARLYPEAPDNRSRTDGKTIYGISKQKVTYIPNAQGTLEVPAIELAWWNTRTDEQSRATLPAQTLQVGPGAAGTQPDALPPAAAPRATQASPTAAIAKHAVEGAGHPGWGRRLAGGRAWLAGAGVLAISLLAFASIVGRSRRRKLPAALSDRPLATVRRKKTSLQALHRACLANDRHAAAQALLELARAEWPEAPPRGLGALAARLDAGRAEVSALDRSLYGAAGAQWQGSALWHVARSGLRQVRSDTRHDDDGMEALYR